MITLTLKIEIFALINCWISIYRYIDIDTSIDILFGLFLLIVAFFSLSLSPHICLFDHLVCVFFAVYLQSLFFACFFLLGHIFQPRQPRRYFSFILSLSLRYLFSSVCAHDDQLNPFQINHEFYYQFMDSTFFFFHFDIECLFYCNHYNEKK